MKSLEPGEWVFFIDIDEIQWGPWEIKSVEEKKVVVLLDNLLTFPIPKDRLAKVEDENRISCD